VSGAGFTAQHEREAASHRARNRAHWSTSPHVAGKPQTPLLTTTSTLALLRGRTAWAKKQAASIEQKPRSEHSGTARADHAGSPSLAAIFGLQLGLFECNHWLQRKLIARSPADIAERQSATIGCEVNWFEWARRAIAVERCREQSRIASCERLSATAGCALSRHPQMDIVFPARYARAVTVDSPCGDRF